MYIRLNVLELWHSSHFSDLLSSVLVFIVQGIICKPRLFSLALNSC